MRVTKLESVLRPGYLPALVIMAVSTVAVWLMNGTATAGSPVLGTQPLDWRIAGVGMADAAV